MNAAQMSVPRDIRIGSEDSMRDQFARSMANVTITWLNSYYESPIPIVNNRNAGAPPPAETGITVGDVFAIIFAVLLAIGILAVGVWIVWDWRRKRASNVTNV